jgi:hypothetical protein
MEEFRNFFGLKGDTVFVKAFEAFMSLAHENFRWNDYLEARLTAEKTFRLFFEQQKLPKEKLEEALDAFIFSFFNQCIDERQFEWENNHPGEEYLRPADTVDDIDNLYLARVFSCVPQFSDLAEDIAFCDSIGVRYHYEQLHMCVWFAG